ncbi:hypothetical protein SteCoe_29971 [Stentor coeruleus]|uniref:Uncharacterized protein n=1 Tax=Stentor coeruleus TaxID=5963 RepID=A0A1R2B4P8_9CILI|nr:hypothetical protein SteCoe_29971 [Stentor coeruleus]
MDSKKGQPKIQAGGKKTGKTGGKGKKEPSAIPKKTLEVHAPAKEEVKKLQEVAEIKKKHEEEKKIVEEQKQVIKSIPLASLVAEVDANIPKGTIILDPSGNTLVFYKYKGTLIERDSLEWNQATLRNRVKHSFSRGSTLALKINEEDDIDEYLVRGTLDPEIMNRSKVNYDILNTYSSGRDDVVIMQDDYRFVILVHGDKVPHCLEKYISQGDLVTLRII